MTPQELMDDINGTSCFGSMGCFGEDGCNLIIELVQKGIPLEIKETHEFYDLKFGYCKCESMVDEYDSFCPCCGQRLDWGNADV